MHSPPFIYPQGYPPAAYHPAAGYMGHGGYPAPMHMMQAPHTMMYAMPPLSPAISHRYRKRRYSNDFSSDPFDPEPHVVARPVEYPRMEKWLLDIENDRVRNLDTIPYAELADVLVDHGILRLDDLARLTIQTLQDLSRLNVGTASRLLDWAVADKSRLDGSGSRHKRKHHN